MKKWITWGRTDELQAEVAKLRRQLAGEIARGQALEDRIRRRDLSDRQTGPLLRDTVTALADLRDLHREALAEIAALRGAAS